MQEVNMSLADIRFLITGALNGKLKDLNLTLKKESIEVVYYFFKTHFIAEIIINNINYRLIDIEMEHFTETEIIALTRLISTGYDFDMYIRLNPMFKNCKIIYESEE